MMHKAWIYIWRRNDAKSLMLLRRGALLFLKVIRQISWSYGSKKRRIWLRLGVSGLLLQFEFTNGYEIIHKAWSSIEEMPYCFWRSSVRFQGQTAKKNHRFWPKLGISGLSLQFEFTNGYEMQHKAWSSIEEVPSCFWRSSVKCQGHTAKKIVDFDPN